MNRSVLFADNPLYDYLVDTSVRESASLKWLREKTQALPQAIMAITPEQGQFMGLLVSLIQAKRILELGMFTGYSTLWMAQQLPDDGCLVTCENSCEHLELAQNAWRQAGVADKIRVEEGLALETLTRFKQQGEEAFDFAFMDADKPNHMNYYDALLPLMRTGGLIAIDNAFKNGTVIEPSKYNNPGTKAVRELNNALLEDERVQISLVPFGDGLFLAQKL